jgi:hypothetical protein
MLPRLAAASLAACAATAPAEPPPDATGLYEIRQMEMAGGLELMPDGRFRYALEYGAVSEQGEGRWLAKGEEVALTSDPMPRAPAFEVLKDEPAAPGELWVSLAPPGFGNWTAPLELIVTLRGSSEPFSIRAGADGHVPLDGKMATSIQPVVPVYGLPGPPIPLTAASGHKILLRFQANDLGRARFDREPLTREGDTLVLYRYDAKIVFKPVQPRPR